MFLVERIASDGFELIEVIGLFEVLGHLGVPFAEVTGAVALVAEDIGIEAGDCFGLCDIVLSR